MVITEAKTRSELIDAQLGASGWNVKDPTQVVEELDILTSLPECVAKPRTKYEGHQQSSSDLEAFYDALSQRAFKGALDLSRVQIPAIDIKQYKVEAA